MESTVLVVDDRPLPRHALAMELTDAGFRVVEAGDGVEAWSRFQEAAPDLVITDVVMPRSDGIELVGRIRRQSEVPVIVFSAQGTVDAAVAALKSGANEFLASSDPEADALVALATRLLGHGATPAAGRILSDRLVGESPTTQRARDRLAALAPLDEPVLFSGEQGTGRDTAARTLHELRHGTGGAFLVVSPPGIDRPRLPRTGTVYLDEVEQFAPEAQCAWRDALDRKGRKAALRFVASASPVLRLRIEQGAFDSDLGNRLLRFEVALPSLRERPEDVPRIARALLARTARDLGRPGVSFEPRALERLRAEHWAGNVAELGRVVEKLVGFATSPLIRRWEVDEVLAEVRLSVAHLRDRASCEERERLITVLSETGGNVSRAAERLGRSRAAVYRLIHKHGLPLRREF